MMTTNEKPAMKNKKALFILFALALFLAVAVLLPDLPSEAASGKWVKSAKGWWYSYSDGSYAKGWKKIGGKWYYFDASGYMASNEWRRGYWLSKNGTQTYKGRAKWGSYKDSNGKTKWYYSDDQGWGAMGWQKIDGKWYYFYSGYAIAGLDYKMEGKTYSFADNGALNIGWFKKDGKWYYANSSGALVMRSWKKISGKWYFFDRDGCMRTGPNYIDGEWQIFGTSGAWIKPTKDLSKVKVGEQVYFGNYEQDNNLKNGKEPILWRVMDKKDGKLLLVSEFILDLLKQSSTVDCWIGRWKDSPGREFLNGKFMNAAFSAAERKKIQKSRIKNTIIDEEYDENDKFIGETLIPCEDTEDYVFLLSWDEACRYYKVPEKDRFRSWVNTQWLTNGTKYANAKGLSCCVNSMDPSKELCADWRLRTGSTAGYENDPYAINAAGRLTIYGAACVAQEGFRPAVWVEP